MLVIQSTVRLFPVALHIAKVCLVVVIVQVAEVLLIIVLILVQIV